MGWILKSFKKRGFMTLNQKEAILRGLLIFLEILKKNVHQRAFMLTFNHTNGTELRGKIIPFHMSYSILHKYITVWHQGSAKDIHTTYDLRAVIF